MWTSAAVKAAKAASMSPPVTAVRVASNAGTDDFAAVSAAFKRMKNILAQAREKGIEVPAAVEEALLLEPEETALAERASDLAVEVHGFARDLLERGHESVAPIITGLPPEARMRGRGIFICFQDG